MIKTHNRPLPPWVLWAGVLVSGGLTTLLFCYFDWPRHIVVMLLAAAVLLCLFKNALEERDRRFCVTGAVLGGVLSATYVVGGKIERPNLEFYPFKVWDLVWFFVLFAAFYLVAVGMYTIVTRWNLLQDAEPDGGKAAFRYWLCMFALLLVCWMPSYLTFYPGCVTPDSAASIDQALGTAWENTHPVLFTLLVTPFMRFGSAVGNLTLGVALFSLFQMLLLAGILAYGLTWLRRKRIRKVGICFVGLYFIVSQVFPLYAISMWKDVLFGAVVLLLTLCLYDIWESKGGELLHAKGLLKFVILCLLTCFMRNNGVYVTFVLLIIMAIYYRRYFKRLAPVFAAVMAAVVLIQGPLYTAIGIRPSPFQEAVGVPLQQVARTVVMDGKMTDEQREYLNRLLPLEEYDSYTPYTVDNIKGHAHFDREYFNQTKGEFMKVWAGMLFPNFKHYVKAYMMETVGYWHVSVKNWIVSPSTSERDIGLVEVDWIQRITGKSMRGFLLGLADFITVGGMVWIVIFLLGAVIMMRRKGAWLYFLPVILVWGTNMIAAPTYAEFRYLFSFALCIPFLTAALFMRGRRLEDAGDNSADAEETAAAPDGT